MKIEPNFNGTPNQKPVTLGSLVNARSIPQDRFSDNGNAEVDREKFQKIHTLVLRILALTGEGYEPIPENILQWLQEKTDRIYKGKEES